MTTLDKTELLHEALLDLERANAKEREIRLEAEALLAGLQALTTSSRGSDVFVGLLKVLQGAIGFENAFILASKDNDKTSVVAATEKRFLDGVWTTNGFLKRITFDRPIAFFDISSVTEWQNQQGPTREGVRSALHVLLRPPPHPAILVCTHSERGFFGPRQLRLSTRFAPLASQALMSLEYTKALEQVNVRLEQEIAERISAQNIAEKSQILAIDSSKMAALGEMAGGIAHEINTPLAIIHTTAGQLQEIITDEPMDRSLAAEMAATIETTAERIAKIILSMRSFSRKTTDDPMAPEPIHRIIEETLVLCAERFKQHNVRLDIPPLTPTVQVNCRANEVSQILLNLLNNAFDVLSTKSSDKKWVRLDVVIRETTVELSVTDSGPGILPDARARMFQPFFTTKEVGKGTGLGLSISKRLAESHGGDLYIDQYCPNTKFVLKLNKATV